MKTLYKWHIKCSNKCKNSGGILELFFVTENNIAPEITCGPCGNKPITDIQFVESYTISE